MNSQYEVLSPWAEADPVPLRGISPRIKDFSGRKIGLLCNTKRAARPITNAVERQLKEKFPSLEISIYVTMNAIGPEEIATPNKAKFEAWLQGVDAVVTIVGD